MTTPNEVSKVWFITGTSQGFGQELVRAALDRGDRVVATSRQPAKVVEKFKTAGDRLLAVPLDLSDAAGIERTVAEVVRKFGRIDVLINNAGHGLLGAIEEAADDEIKNVFETNVFGLLRLTRAVLPHMRNQKSGHIVNLSSIGGLIGIPGWGIYNATKFAVEGISEALAHECKPLNIGVTVVEPGPFRTDFLGGSLATVAKHLPAYDETAGKTREYQESNNGKQAGDPVAGARAIVDAVTGPNPPLHLVLGAIALQRATDKLKQLQDEFAKWKDVTLATDFPR